MRKVFGLYSLALMWMCLASVSTFAEPPATRGSHELKLSRPTANPALEGAVVIKATDLGNDSPFLRVEGTDGSLKDYLIKTCDESCQKAINACKGGEPCSIRGRVDENVPSIMAEFVRVGASATPSVETKTSKQADGQVVTWTRDTSKPKLGEAWRDPSGMIWGDIAKKEDGSPHFMTHKNATAYCAGLKDAQGKSIGAVLPIWEDFIRLREYMGAKSGSDEGYAPQVLPNLTYTENGQTRSRYFWSSSVDPDYSNFAYDFDGRLGGSYYRNVDDYRSVRCVVARPKPRTKIAP